MLRGERAGSYYLVFRGSELSPLDRAIKLAIVIVKAKTLITRWGVVCRGELVEHRLAQPSVPIIVNV